MINITITGNVYDEDILTNCYYDVYYVIGGFRRL